MTDARADLKALIEKEIAWHEDHLFTKKPDHVGFIRGLRHAIFLLDKLEETEKVGEAAPAQGSATLNDAQARAYELISEKLRAATNRPVILSWEDAEAIKAALHAPVECLAISLCPRCEGSGIYNFGQCAICDGSGRINDEGLPYQHPAPTSFSPAQGSAEPEQLGVCDSQTGFVPHTKCRECVNWRPAPPSVPPASPELCRTFIDGPEINVCDRCGQGVQDHPEAILGQASAPEGEKR